MQNILFFIFKQKYFIIFIILIVHAFEIYSTHHHQFIYQSTIFFCIFVMDIFPEKVIIITYNKNGCKKIN